MRKAFLKALQTALIFAALFVAAGCGARGTAGSSADGAQAADAAASAEPGAGASPEDTATTEGDASEESAILDDGVTTAEEDAAPESALEENSLDRLLSSQSLRVTNLRLNHRSDSTTLVALVENETGSDIASVTLSFAAWDEDDKPLRLALAEGSADDAYLLLYDMPDAGIADGKSGRAEIALKGMRGDISTLKAAVVSYTDGAGAAHENPYYGAFRALYEGNPLDPPLHTVEPGFFINHIHIARARSRSPYCYIYAGTASDGSDARFVDFASTSGGALSCDVNLARAGITESGAVWLFIRDASEMWYGIGDVPEGTGALSRGVRYDYTFEAPAPPASFTVSVAQNLNHARVRASGCTAPYYYIYIGAREDGSDARFVSFDKPYSGPASSYKGSLDSDIDLERAGITQSGTYYVFLKAAVTWWQGEGDEPALTSAMSPAVRYRYTRRD